MVIQALKAAIKGQFTGGSAIAALVTAFAGRYFREEAPAQNPGASTPLTFPYVVSEFPASMGSSESYGTIAAGCLSTEPVVIFKVLNNGEAATDSSMKILTDALDDVPLTLASGKNLAIWREQEPVSLHLGRDDHGVDVWQSAVAYRYAIQ